MAKISLNLLYLTRAGFCDIFLESIKDVLPQTLTYDNINYSPYLPVMISEIEMLQFEQPELYNEFNRGNYALQFLTVNLVVWNQIK